MDTAPYRRLLRGTCLVGLVLPLLSTPARAATIELSALASLTQDLQVTATDPITPVTAAIANGGRSAEARADFGALRAFSSLIQIGVGQAGAISSWADQFTITGETVGSLVPFLVTFQVDGTLSVPDERAGALYGAMGSQYSQVGSWLLGLPPSVEGCVATGLIALGPGCSYSAYERLERGYDLLDEAFPLNHVELNDLSKTFVVSLEVGRRYDVSQVLWVHSWISGMSAASTSADYLGTAHFYLDPLGTGYGYTTGSGTDYQSAAVAPVPEPATMSLLALGLAGMGARRWRTSRNL